MRTVLIGSDFMYDVDGNLKPIEINTAVGWHNNTIEPESEQIDLTTLNTFITNNSFTKVVYIGNISNLDVHLSGSCTTLGIQYEKHTLTSNAVTIPFIEDNDETLIIRSSYDTTALVDDTYCRDKVNFLNLIKDSTFASQFVYMDENNSIVNNITTINDNGNHPNFILKARLPNYDKDVYPKFYKVSTQGELDTLISNVVSSEYFLMEFHLNQTELIEDHIKVFRGLNLLFPPNLESISLGGYTRTCDDKITIDSSFNPTTFELISGREKYIAGNYQLVLPKLSDTDLVLMADDTYKVATELVVGDILKTIDIPNPFNVVDGYEVANYRISQSQLEGSTTYSTNAITNIRRINTHSKIVKITFTDGSDWFDNQNSNYLSIRNNEVRFLTLRGGQPGQALTIGDNVLLLDTSNLATPLFILKEVSNIEMVTEFFGGYEITVENAHLFLTKSDVDSDKSYVSIEHNGVDCTYSILGNCESGQECGKQQLCCPGVWGTRNCFAPYKCPACSN